MFGALVSLAHDIACGDELFKDFRSRCRRSQPFAFRILRNILRSCTFHSGQQSIFREMLGRRSFAFFELRHHRRKVLPNFQLRNGIFPFGCFLLNPVSDATEEGCLWDLPTHLCDGFALGLEGDTFTFQRDSGFIIDMRFTDRAKQTHRNELQHIPFTGRKRKYITPRHTSGRNNRVVIRNLAVVDYLIGFHRQMKSGCKRKFCGNSVDQLRQHTGHIAGQIPAVRARVSKQLFLIQGLHIIQRLLGGEAKQTVGVTLQAGQIIESGRIFLLLLFLNVLDHCGVQIAKFLNSLSFCFIFQALCSCDKPAAYLHGIKRFWLKSCNSRFSAHDQGKRRRHDTTNIERYIVQQREDARSIDSHQPVSLLTAQRCLIQRFILASIMQIFKTGANGCFLQGGNPQAFDGLGASALMVDQTEDQLAFPACIRCTYDGFNLGIIYQFANGIKLPPGIQRYVILPFIRQNGQIVPLPFGISFIIGIRLRKLHQMADTPCNQMRCANKITIFLISCAQHLTYGLSYAGLFSDNQLHLYSPFYLSHKCFSCKIKLSIL